MFDNFDFNKKGVNVIFRQKKCVLEKFVKNFFDYNPNPDLAELKSRIRTATLG
jgi:hypothetical protein